MPGKFSRLEAAAGIDDDVRPLGNVRLQILGDGKMLLDAKLAGNVKDPKLDPLRVSLDVAGVRRLVLIVQSLGNFGAGDHLDLGNLEVHQMIRGRIANWRSEIQDSRSPTEAESENRTEKRLAILR